MKRDYVGLEGSYVDFGIEQAGDGEVTGADADSFLSSFLAVIMFKNSEVGVIDFGYSYFPSGTASVGTTSGIFGTGATNPAPTTVGLIPSNGLA